MRELENPVEGIERHVRWFRGSPLIGDLSPLTEPLLPSLLHPSIHPSIHCSSRIMSKYKKSAVDFAGLDLPSKYQFRRTEWVKEPAAAGEFDSGFPSLTTLPLHTKRPSVN